MTPLLEGLQGLRLGGDESKCPASCCVVRLKKEEEKGTSGEFMRSENWNIWEIRISTDNNSSMRFNWNLISLASR